MGNLELAQYWMDFSEVLKLFTDSLTKEWPKELPPEDQPQTEAFWQVACREEMRTRQTLSLKIQRLLKREARDPMTPIEGWLFRRRIEWATQLAMSKFESEVLPPVPIQEALEWALVQSWESDGCQAMWLHAERDGKMHPEAADWLRGLQ